MFNSDQSGDAFFEANSRDGNNYTSDDGPGQILQVISFEGKVTSLDTINHNFLDLLEEDTWT